jgi:hypothetical protein
VFSMNDHPIGYLLIANDGDTEPEWDMSIPSGF